MSPTVVKLSHLLELPVEDENGRALGHVHDVRVRRVGSEPGADAASYEIDALIVGRRGLRARFGWARARGLDLAGPGDALAWEDVLAVEPDRLVVRRRRDDRRSDRSGT